MAVSEPARLPAPTEVDRPWVAAYPPGVPATYRWPAVALPRLLDDAARDFPDVDAVRRGGHAWTWREVADRVDEVAGALARVGVGVGDRVAMALPNGPAAAATAFATWRLGAVLVLLDADLPVLAREEALVATAPRVVVAEPTTAGTHLAAGRRVVAVDHDDWAPPGRWARLRDRLRRGRGPDRVDPADTDDAPEVARDDHEAADAVVTWADLLADAPARPAPPRPQVDPDAVAVLSPTGGATGRRRVVALTHRNLVANAFQARLWVPDVQAGREVVLAAVPFTHLFGLTAGLLTAALAAGTLAVPDRLDGDGLAACATAHAPTLFPAVPSAVRALVEVAERRPLDLSSLRVCLVGGAPLPPEVATRFRSASGQARLREGYGLAEAGTLTHANPVYGRAEPGRVGLPVTGTVAAVVAHDDPGRLLAPGEVGRLVVAGPQVMRGYWHDDEATKAVLHEGWLRTGELAVVDAAGSFALVDRAVDVVQTAGGTAYPSDVEAALAAHGDVVEVAASGRARPDGTGEVVAAVVLRADATATEATLLAHATTLLPAHAVPARVAVVDSLPPVPDGTVVRHRAAAPFDEEVAG